MRLASLLTRLKTPPRLTRLDWALLLVPGVLWASLFQIRDHVVGMRCATHPELCRPEQLFAFDRIAVTQASGLADQVSLVTQNLSGILALLIPLLWLATRRGERPLSGAGFREAAWTDLILLGQASLWNGLTTETIRLVVQRPRPFVYADPIGQGAASAHYTSFVSGHTSFSAAACVTGLLLLLGRGAPGRLLWPTSIVAASLVVTTGLCRVLAGRHFTSDVVGGALTGTAVALAVALLHRSWRPTC